MKQIRIRIVKEKERMLLGEMHYVQRLLKLYPTGILSVVSDTWDYWKVLTETLPILKDEIMAREGKLVIRPDSSPKTPYEIIVGDKDAEPGTPEYRGTIEILWDLFGGTVNEAGFKLLDDHIGMIYGDSITLALARKINLGLKNKGVASINWVAGIGSFTYQYLTRDTLGSAMKATFGIVNGETREIFKDPATDKGGCKKSAKGLIAVHLHKDGVLRAHDQTTWDDVMDCEYESVFRNGELRREHTLAEIRERVSSQF